MAYDAVKHLFVVGWAVAWPLCAHVLDALWLLPAHGWLESYLDAKSLSAVLPGDVSLWAYVQAYSEHFSR